MSLSKMTRLLVEIIEDAVGEFGELDRTPLIDDIAEDYRKAASIRSKAAHDLIERRLDTALRVLEDDGWTPVKVTSYYVDNYKGADPDHPTTDVEIVRCVAGGGSGLPTHAIHFCVESDCVLFLEARIRGLEAGEGFAKHQVRRMNGAAESGLLTSDAIEAVARESGIAPRKDLLRVHRIASKVQQRRLALKP